jgi:hypothetical protein
MSERATQLFEIADGQLSDPIDLFATRDESVLRLPCPGREKLGDGTVAACASHTAENYLRIAAFLGGRHTGDTHSSPHHAQGVDRQGLLERLSAGREALSGLGDLTEEQLDTVRPASEMKFSDGQRTLEQVVTSLLRHQRHQLDALKVP